jgi:large subunit ribosomal protein L17
MLKNLASSLFLTERDAELDDNQPKVKGRVITTLPKAKEVRPLVEKCITIARRALPHAESAEQYAADAERGSDAWRKWRTSDKWRQWADARAPVIAARRRALQLLGDKQAVQVLFDEVAPRFLDRPGGYTRILKLATPRLGDAGARAIIEFVGVRDRVVAKSGKPAFGDQDEVDDDVKETSDPVAGDNATDSEADAADADAEATDADSTAEAVTTEEEKSDE